MGDSMVLNDSNIRFSDCSPMSEATEDRKAFDNGGAPLPNLQTMFRVPRGTGHGARRLRDGRPGALPARLVRCGPRLPPAAGDLRTPRGDMHGREHSALRPRN